MARTGASEFVYARLGARELIGRRYSARDIVRLLSIAHPEHAMELIGRVSAVLDNASDPTAPEVQIRILRGLFGSESLDVIRRFETELERNPQIVAFEEIGLLLTSRLLMCSAPRGASASFEETMPLVGRAILACNDLIRDERLISQHAPPVSAADIAAWGYYLHLIQFSRHNPNELSDIVAADQVLTRISTSRFARDGVPRSLSDVFETTAKISLDTYHLLLFALQLPLRGIEPEVVADRLCYVDEESFISDRNLRASRGERLAFLSLIADDIERHRSRNTTRYKRLADRPFDHLTLFTRPVVRSSGKLFVPSLRLLRAKAGFSLIPSVLFSVPASQRNAYFSHFGHCIQQLVEERARAAMPNAIVVTDSDISSTDPLRGRRIVDIVAHSPNATLLIEVKTATVTDAVASGLGVDVFRAWLDPIVRDCFGQFAGTLDSLAAGGFVARGITGPFANVVPVIVTGFPLYPTRFLLSYLREMASSVLPRSIAQQLVVASVSDFGELQRLSDSGVDAAQVIAGWAADDSTEDRSLRMFLFRSGQSVPAQRNLAEETAFQGLMSRIGLPND